LHCICQNNQFEIVQYILAMRREINLNIKDNNGKLPIDLAREIEQMGIYGWESEKRFQERKINCAKIIELLESFERNPIETRTKLRIQLGFTGNSFFLKKKFLNFSKIFIFQDKDSVSIFSIMVLLSDSYLDFKIDI